MVPLPQLKTIVHVVGQIPKWGLSPRGLVLVTWEVPDTMNIEVSRRVQTLKFVCLPPNRSGILSRSCPDHSGGATLKLRKVLKMTSQTTFLELPGFPTGRPGLHNLHMQIERRAPFPPCRSRVPLASRGQRTPRLRPCRLPPGCRLVGFLIFSISLPVLARCFHDVSQGAGISMCGSLVPSIHQYSKQKSPNIVLSSEVDKQDAQY